MELLAPAGGRFQLEAALRFGADAVYLACDRFGMRQRAENFALADIPDAVRLAHDAGAAVHVTLNTLMDADDIDALPGYLEALADAGVDAFIVSDLGAFTLAQEHAPGVALHVSTQASVANAAAARRWHDMGAARVVCAREMGIEDIARLRADAPRELEIEAFAHGAMCVAVSGRCLLSAAMTGRSGNKGHCSQSCRWSYALVEEKRPGEYFPIEEGVRGSFVLNAQDLCMIDHLDDLAAAGVDSIKLEGRNKKAFYVATVVHAYRAVLDGADPASVHDDLLAISHRPYGTGFYYGQPNQTPERDGYVKECLHVATVTACEPAGQRGATCGAAAGRAGERAADDSAGERAAAGEPAGERGMARGASDPAVERVAAGESAGECVVGSQPERGGTSWIVEAQCHNRFCEGDELELLAPHRPIEKIRVEGLRWLPDPTEDDPAPHPVTVGVANRSMARYRFTVGTPLQEGDLLRARIAREGESR